ncbi:glycosyl transferase [Catenuloplanes indicus JCM 9534]
MIAAPARRVEPAAGVRCAGAWWPHLVAVGVYLALGLVVMGRYLADPNGTLTSHVPADHTWFQWLLSHGAHAVRHLENPLFSTAQNAPDGVNMMANTSVLGVTIPMTPVTMLFGPRVAYVVWMVGACAGTATAAYWALRRYLVRGGAAAFAGGAFAGFAPGVVHHANGQPNFVSSALIPLILVAVARLGAGGRWRRDGLVLGALVTWQLFVNEEVLLVTAIACAVMTVAWAASRPDEARRRWRSFGAALGVTALTAGLLCAYPIWFQFHGPGAFDGMPAFNTWGEDPVTWVTFARDTIAGTPAAELTQGRIEQNSWFGWPLVLVVAVALVMLWRRTAIARTSLAVIGVTALLSLGPRVRLGGTLTGVPGPQALLGDGVPVLNLAMPSRMTYAVIGAFAVLLALAWDRVPGRVVRTAIVLALVPLIPQPLPAMPDRLPPHFITAGTWRSYVPDGTTMVTLPPPDNWAGREQLSWSAWAGHEYAVPEGYFLGPDVDGAGHVGPARRSRATALVHLTIEAGAAPAVSAEDRATVRAEVTRWNGAVVVVRDELFLDLAEQLFGPATRVDDVWLWDLR